MNKRIEIVVNGLIDNKIDFKAVVVGNEEQDHEISVTEQVHIQVSTEDRANYFSVCREEKDGTFTMFPYRKTLASLIRDVKKALA